MSDYDHYNKLKLVDEATLKEQRPIYYSRTKKTFDGKDTGVRNWYPAIYMCDGEDDDHAYVMGLSGKSYHIQKAYIRDRNPEDYRILKYHQLR